MSAIFMARTSLIPINHVDKLQDYDVSQVKRRGDN